jgi:hypothetical protein
VYSQFAFEALQVENGMSLKEMEEILYQFYGQPASMATGPLLTTLLNAKMPRSRLHDVIEHLYALGFLGVEMQKGTIQYARDVDDATATKALIRRRLEASDRHLMFWVHPAFRKYLEIAEPRPIDSESVQPSQ